MTIPTPNPPHRMKHGSGISIMERSNETMRLTGPRGESVWIQNGTLYNDAGKKVDEPAWFGVEFNKLTPRMRAKHAKREKISLELQEPEMAGADLDDLKKADLMQIARDEGVDVSDSDTKAMIVNKILANRE